MAATSKFSRSHVDIRTALPADRVAAISKAVGDVTKGNVAIGVNHVRFEGAGPGRTSFSIRAFRDAWELMTFRVDIEATAAGTSVRSRIESFKTRQNKIFMIIPVALAGGPASGTATGHGQGQR